jgi:Tol biopolymer transport system component
MPDTDTYYTMAKAVCGVTMLLGVAAAQTSGAGNLFDSQGDIGVTPKAGTMEYDAGAGEYRVTGGGANIWGTADAFHFAWKRLSGDFTFTADVHFIGSGTVAHRKAVLMARQDPTPGSAYADVALHGDGLASLQYRLTSGAETQEIRSTVNAPTRIRLERAGNRFTVRVGKPGEELVSSGPETVELTGPIYVGIGVSSHDANILETAVFSNVRLEQHAAGPPQQRYRSSITIYDLSTRSSSVVYKADTVIEAPNWSHDGKFLLVNTGGDLYRLPLSAAGEPKLEKIDLGAGGYRCNNDKAFSWDGAMLGFSASSPSSRGSQVYVAHADGTAAKLLTPASPSYFHGWSPDGHWLAFVGQREGKFELYRVAATGGAEERLTSKGAYDDGPEYSPDGKWIYFNSNRSGGWKVWRIPAQGGGPGDVQAEQITNDDLEDWFPHISPDGKWMLVFSFPKGTEGHNDRLDGVALRLMPAPGKKLKPAKPELLTTFFGGQGTINVNSWSPDSKKFAYVVYEPLPSHP